ncbi:hypothetical protein BVG19_g5221 [[Candida] boidinii]|nr:hypothetical protein BVG19_g5221 [[Candida] boidinii]OWB52706.1 phosphatidylinositol phosphate binding protein [[Candida] boidinii]OWB70224.1 phosphatidylinositol phosphate binding protein [[Candida] boidinii]OWB84511.1 phosphatidylinositol phosphate binding protein [[Candida] boidinii]GMF99970.1 unnamed protein product [[Candida] boidinii]
MPSLELDKDPKVISILSSDASLDILLTRLKQSIKSCDEFSHYIKRRSTYEDDHSKDMKKLSLNTKQSIKSNCVSTKGSFVENLNLIVSFDEKLSTDVINPFVKALEKMYDELNSLSINFTKLRKMTKDEGLRKEKEVLDSINLAEKAKHKYFSLCYDLERLRNSDPTKKTMTLKGTKTSSQQEEELIKKIQAADNDYHSKSLKSQSLKNDLSKIHRPNINKKLNNLIIELETALCLQLQKFSTYNESLIIGMGNQVAPLSSNSNHNSMKSYANSIDVEKNLLNYIKSSKPDYKTNFVPIEYEKHRLFGGTSSHHNIQNHSNNSNNSTSNNINTRKISNPTMTSSTAKNSAITGAAIGTGIALGSATLNPSPLSGRPQPQQQQHNDSAIPKDANPHPPRYNTLDPARSPALTGPRPMNVDAQEALNSANELLASTDPKNGHFEDSTNNNNNNNEHHEINERVDHVDDYSADGYEKIADNNDRNYENNDINNTTANVGATPVKTDVPDYKDSVDEEDDDDDDDDNSIQKEYPSHHYGLFGLGIEQVPHDEEMVPYFVKKCISLIETYGEDAEGIYRSSPNVTKVEELRELINSNPNDLSVLDPPDPNVISNDYIYCIASLLKSFFSKLPDPLLTKEKSPDFLRAGEIPDSNTMRVQLHRIVFELPDCSYFTLRDLLFHFVKLTEIPKIRMNAKNLSIVWCTNLLSAEFTNKEEFDIQQRVIEELIYACKDIFDPKDD